MAAGPGFDDLAFASEVVDDATAASPRFLPVVPLVLGILPESLRGRV